MIDSRLSWLLNSRSPIIDWRFGGANRESSFISRPVGGQGRGLASLLFSEQHRLFPRLRRHFVGAGAPRAFFCDICGRDAYADLNHLIFDCSQGHVVETRHRWMRAVVLALGAAHPAVGVIACSWLWASRLSSVRTRASYAGSRPRSHASLSPTGVSGNGTGGTSSRRPPRSVRQPSTGY